MQHTIKIKNEEKIVDLPEGYNAILVGICQTGDKVWNNVENAWNDLNENSIHVTKQYQCAWNYCTARKIS